MKTAVKVAATVTLFGSMAMATQMAVPDNQISSIADVLAKVSPLIFGSGKTTTTEESKSTVDPGVMANNDAILQALIPQITGTAATDPVVANILQKAQMAFAPVVANQNASGLYNSTVLQQLRSEATARATGEASAAVLQHQSQSAQIATQAAGNALNATRGTVATRSQQTAPVASPNLLKSIGTSLAGKYAMDKAKKLFSSDPDAAKEAAKVLGNPAAMSQANNIGNSNLTSDMTSDAWSGAGSASSSVGASTDAATSVAGGSIDAASALSAAAPDIMSLDSIIADTNASLAGGADFAGTAAADADIDYSQFVANGGDSFASSGGSDVADSFVGDIYGDIGGSVAGGFADAGGSAFADAFVSDVYGDAAGGLAGDDLGGAVPYLGAAYDVSQGNYGGAVGSVVGSFFGPVGTVVGGAIGGAVSVICTESVRQGLMSAELLAAEYAVVSKRVTAQHYRGYKFLAAPIVKWMQKNKTAAKFFAWGAKKYAYHQLGTPTFVGDFLQTFIEPICFLVGYFVPGLTTLPEGASHGN
jgi:hypothetical protein